MMELARALFGGLWDIAKMFIDLFRTVLKEARWK